MTSGDLVAVNKPYGMRIHGGGDAVHSVLTLTELLPQLASIVGAEKLHMVHRLDVNTTGEGRTCYGRSYVVWVTLLVRAVLVMGVVMLCG